MIKEIKILKWKGKTEVWFDGVEMPDNFIGIYVPLHSAEANLKEKDK